MRILNLPRYVIVGILELLWHFCAEYTPDGAVGKYTNQRIAAAIGYEGDAGKLIKALVAAGWLDRSDEHRLIVHDWSSHADDAVNMKLFRARLSFADGQTPNPSRIPLDERRRIMGKNEEECGHGMPTAVPTALPSPAQAPPLPAPSPSHPHPKSGNGTGNSNGNGMGAGGIGRDLSKLLNRAQSSDASLEETAAKIRLIDSLKPAMNSATRKQIIGRSDITSEFLKTQIQDILRDTAVGDVAAVLVTRSKDPGWTRGMK
jgi:hypothetical protein